MSSIAIDTRFPRRHAFAPITSSAARAVDDAAPMANPPEARLLIIPGLRDSGPNHWQTWLQRLYPNAVRVEQRDWARADLERWAARIGSTLERAGGGAWLAVAHSFGCLALARHLASRPATAGAPSPIVAALLVAPADPDKFGAAELLPAAALPVPSMLVVSETDPWMRAAAARRWAARWGSRAFSLGDAGHVNPESGHSTLPLARRWVSSEQERVAAARATLASTVLA